MFQAIDPFDEHNRRLKKAVHPDDWQNPTPKKLYNMVVIGGGTAGLVTAAIAAGLGAKTALIEKELLGGDCLNSGCVPSKALIQSSRVAQIVRNAQSFGIQLNGQPEVDFGEVMTRMRKIRADISPHDSVERFSKMGVDIFLGHASFQSKNEISVGDKLLKYKRACIATGAKPRVPPIPGLDETPFLTNETVFSLTSLPSKVAVIGGGPIGCELAQCFKRFGADVSIFEQGNHILASEDELAATTTQKSLLADGVQLFEKVSILRVEGSDDTKTVYFRDQHNAEQSKAFDIILVATGRQPNTKELGLENAGIEYDQNGIMTNDHLRTSNRLVFAAGDVTPNIKFTHAADFMARTVIQNALFPWPKKKFSRLVIPHAIYTSPEIGQVGLTEKELSQRSGLGRYDVHQLDFVDNDRAIVDEQTEGFVKVITRKGKDRIVGATVVGSKASEMIGYFSMAMTNGLGLSNLGTSIFPYPTQSEFIRKFGDLYSKSRFTPLKKGLLKKWFG